MRIDWRDRVRGRLARAARMAVFGAGLGIVVGAATARQVRADVVEATGASSSVLAQLAELPDLGAGLTRLSLNGESVHVAATVVARSVDEVVQGIERSCRAGIEGMENADAYVASLSGHASAPARFDLKEALLEAARSVTSRNGDTTTVLCVADTDATRGQTLRGRLAEFARTRDLAAVGSLRHFTISPVEAGTRIIAAWLPGRFPLDQVFPESGDAPGTDAAGVPRPAGARRLFTAGAEDHAHVIRIYEIADASAREDVIARDYGSALARDGWHAHEGVGVRMPRSAILYGLGDRDLLVQIRSDARSGRVFVSTIDMRAPRAGK